MISSSGPPAGLGVPIPHGYYIRHPLAVELVDDLMALVENVNPYRPEGCLLYGPAYNGKTFMLRELIRRIEVLHPPTNKQHQAEEEPSIPVQPRLRQLDQIPVVYMRAPRKASHKGLFAGLAKPLRTPLSDRCSLAKMQDLIWRGLIRVGVKVIIIDELQHLISGGRLAGRAIIDELKVMSDELCIPIIAAGTERARNVIESDDQYLSRFKPRVVPTWEYGPGYGAILRAFEEEMHLPLGSFTGREASQAIFILSKGLIGETVGTLNSVRKIAYKDGSVRIRMEHIKQFAERQARNRG